MRSLRASLVNGGDLRDSHLFTAQPTSSSAALFHMGGKVLNLQRRHENQESARIRREGLITDLALHLASALALASK